MKLFKLIVLILLAIILSFFLFKKILYQPINPISQQNTFYSRIDDALQTSQLSPINLKIRDYQNQVEFYLENETNNYTKITLSTQKDPYWQISSLQDFFKTAKINNKQVKLVDLSVDHPYAKFENN